MEPIRFYWSKFYDFLTIQTRQNELIQFGMGSLNIQINKMMLQRKRYVILNKNTYIIILSSIILL